MPRALRISRLSRTDTASMIAAIEASKSAGTYAGLPALDVVARAPGVHVAPEVVPRAWGMRQARGDRGLTRCDAGDDSATRRQVALEHFVHVDAELALKRREGEVVLDVLLAHVQLEHA